MDIEFVSRNAPNRKCKSFSGGKIHDLELNNNDLGIKDNNSLVSIMIGSNDVYNRHIVTKELIDKYRNLIRKLKEKTSKLGNIATKFCGIKIDK